MIRIVTSLILVGMLAATPAVAAPSNKKEARKLYKQGKRHFQKKAYAAAVAAFKRSHALFPHRNTVYNIALSLAHQGDRVAAFRYLRKYLRRATPRDPPLDAILKGVRSSYSVLQVLVPDARAAVYVDGRQVGRGTLQRILPAGTRALEIRQGDKVVARKELDLPGGRVAHWDLGALKVTALKPTDDIYLDGRRVGRGQLTQITTLGEHVVELRRDNRVIRRKELRVLAGKTTTWSLQAKVVSGGGKVAGGKPRGRRVAGGGEAPGPGKTRRGRKLHWAWFTTFAAVTVATAVGATVTSLETRKIWEEFKDDRTNRSLGDRGDRMQLAANTLWGVSAALAAGTILAAVFTRWGSSKEKPRVTVTPLLGPFGCGATLTWRH